VTEPVGAVVAVVAHPDDESLIAGGTLALAAAAGAETGVVSLTRGEHGPTSDPALATETTLGAVRERELRTAGRLLGASWTSCLDWPDGDLEWIDQDRAADEVAALLEPAAPSAVLTFGEDGLYGHGDHVAARAVAHLAAARVGSGHVCVYEAAWPAGLVRALMEAAREEGLPAGLWGLDPDAFGSADAAPTLVVDVRPVLMRKLAALRAHRTQVGDDHVLTALPDALAERFLHSEPWRLATDGGREGCSLSRVLGVGDG
jgi:LmbE family N-acetylglucosaminyl deacetylase